MSDAYERRCQSDSSGIEPPLNEAFQKRTDGAEMGAVALTGFTGSSPPKIKEDCPPGGAWTRVLGREMLRLAEVRVDMLLWSQ